eukprot:9099766-Lingulodinium_polyedra.AAC.1
MLPPTSCGCSLGEPWGRRRQGATMTGRHRASAKAAATSAGWLFGVRQPDDREAWPGAGGAGPLTR